MRNRIDNSMIDLEGEYQSIKSDLEIKINRNLTSMEDCMCRIALGKGIEIAIKELRKLNAKF